MNKNSRNNPYVVGRTLQSYDGNRLERPNESPEEPTKPTKKRWWRRVLISTLLLILIPLLIFATWNYINYSAASQKLFGSNNLFGALSSATLSGAERERVNILVVGYSADDPGHQGAKLTDSILIVSLSTVGNNSYMLSIPRDLYITIPENGRARINEAYQRGELDNFSQNGYAIGGIGLLEKTITENFNIPIDYYALVNYAAVRETTDALGGITVNIDSDDPRGLYDPNFQPHEGGPLKLANGPQTIDGQTALRLTRARGSTYGSYGFARSDFDRTKNQQEVFVSIKEAISWEALFNPLTNSRLLGALANNVRTDLEINEALPLQRLFSKVPDGKLNSVTLRDIDGVNYLRDYRSPSGQDTLIPAAGLSNYSDIRDAIEKLNNS